MNHRWRGWPRRRKQEAADDATRTGTLRQRQGFDQARHQVSCLIRLAVTIEIRFTHSEIPG